MTVHGAYRGLVRDDLGWLNSAGRPDPMQTFHRANMPRVGLDDVAAAATGVMLSTPIWLNEGDTVTSLTFISGATALATGTNWWFALYSTAATPALLAQTADQTSTAWAANTVKTVALSAPVKITKSGIYWAAVSVTASTVPTLVGCGTAKPVLTGEGNLAQTSGSALGATAPATIASPTWTRQAPLVIAS